MGKHYWMWWWGLISVLFGLIIMLIYLRVTEIRECVACGGHMEKTGHSVMVMQQIGDVQVPTFTDEMKCFDCKDTK